MFQRCINGLIVYSFRLDHNRCRLVAGYQVHDVISGARAPCETVSFKMKLGTRPHARSFRGVTEELTVRTRTSHSRARPRCRTFSLRSGLNPNNSLSRSMVCSRRHVSHDLRTASCLINQRTVYVYQEFVNRRHQCGSDGIMWVHFALDNFESCEPNYYSFSQQSCLSQMNATRTYVHWQKSAGHRIFPNFGVVR